MDDTITKAKAEERENELKGLTIEGGLGKATLTELIKDVMLCNKFRELKDLKSRISKLFDKQVERVKLLNTTDIRNDFPSLYLREIANVYNTRENNFKQRKLYIVMIICSTVMIFLTGINIILRRP